jgi:hypothetical protein
MRLMRLPNHNGTRSSVSVAADAWRSVPNMRMGAFIEARPLHPCCGGVLACPQCGGVSVPLRSLSRHR